MTRRAELEIVDSHHKVLPAWADFRASLSTAPKLITLDHHTDTSAPFRMHLKNNHSPDEFKSLQKSYLQDLDYKDKVSVQRALEKLNNDEHIVTAIKTDIISSAFVIAHNAADTDMNVYREHKIACRNLKRHDDALESHKLIESLKSFDKILTEVNEEDLLSAPYILDIDLDYFNTFKSIAPDDSKVFKNLIENAGLITVATEPEYVEGCALEPGLDSDYLLKTLQSNFLFFCQCLKFNKVLGHKLKEFLQSLNVITYGHT